MSTGIVKSLDPPAAWLNVAGTDPVFPWRDEINADFLKVTRSLLRECRSKIFAAARTRCRQAAATQVECMMVSSASEMM